MRKEEKQPPQNIPARSWKLFQELLVDDHEEGLLGQHIQLWALSPTQELADTSTQNKNAWQAWELYQEALSVRREEVDDKISAAKAALRAALNAKEIDQEEFLGVWKHFTSRME